MLKDKSNLKSKAIEKAKEILLKKFKGIDEQIETLLNLIKPWYLDPEIFEHPYVINLWGITSVGKTALVKEIINLLNLNNRFFYFNYAYEYNKKEAKQFLMNEFKSENKEAKILCFDEIHLAKSKFDESRFDIDSPSKILWEILGEGKIQIRVNRSDYEYTKKYVDFLSGLIKNGVNVRKGGISIEREIYENLHTENGFFYETWRNKNTFVSLYQMEILDDEISLLFGSMDNFFIELSKLNENEIINFLNAFLKKIENNLEIDCSNFLIFNIGNIDEIYHFTELENYSFDHDYLKRVSNRISIDELKIFLEDRFRDEQIARLGNNHIFFPTLNENDYKEIISDLLDKFSSRIYTRFKIKIEFDKSIYQYLLNYLIYPTKGVRPIHSSINALNSFIASFIAERVGNDYCFDKIKINIKDVEILFELLKGKRLVDVKCREINILKKYRLKNDEDSISQFAVHLTGHFLMNYLQYNKLPFVFSLYSNIKTIIDEGALNSKYFTKNKLFKFVSVLYGGYYAEKLVFGEDNVSDLSQEDIKLATDLSFKMFMKNGFGLYPINYFDLNYCSSYGDESSGMINIEKYIENFLIDAAKLCEKLLNNHYNKLIQISEKLIEKEKLNRDELKKILKKIPLKQKFSINNLI